MIRAYHFVADTLRDCRPVPPDGEWLVHDGRVFMCVSGLHASRHPFDALTYAPGNVLCLVDCDDIVDEEDDKLVCRRRRIVARFDASRLLREFAADCAEEVLHLAVPRAQFACRLAIDAARRHARGECDDDELDAARKDANAVAYAATYGAANAAAYAARAATDAAAYAASYAAARAASYAAARAAATVAADVAYDDARPKQRKRFAALVNAQFAAMGVAL